MEHIDDDALDADALSRLGVEEYTREIDITNIVPTFGVDGVTNWTATNMNPSISWVDNMIQPHLQVDGGALIEGDLVVSGIINNTAIDSIQTVLADAMRSINDLQAQIDLERTLSESERILLESRIIQLETKLMEKDNG